MTKTLREMTDEIRQVNIAKGWRPATGGPGSNTWREYRTLLRSELAEATEAYRDWRLEDATKPICGNEAHTGNPCPEHGTGKPEGVGSEFADAVIRLLDQCDVFSVVLVDEYTSLADVPPLHQDDIPADLASFGDWIDWLYECVCLMEIGRNNYCPGSWFMLRALVTAAQYFGIDLDAEYERKIAYNRTRPYQHGGRTIADTPA